MQRKLQFAFILLISSYLFLTHRSFAQITVKEESKVSFDLNTGFGLFPDLQVPVDGETGLRADGSTEPRTSSDHQGVPLGAMLGYQYDPAPFHLATDLGFLMMNSSQDSSNSVYQRLHAGFEGGYLFYQSFIPLETALRVEGRRSQFRNITSGHTIDSLLPIAKLKAHLGQYWMVEGFYGQSLWNKLSYRSPSPGKTHDFNDATVKTTIFGLDIARRIAYDADFFFGYAREQIDINIPDVYDYRESGLQLNFVENRAQFYSLETQIFTLGFAKHF